MLMVLLSLHITALLLPLFCWIEEFFTRFSSTISFLFILCVCISEVCVNNNNFFFLSSESSLTPFIRACELWTMDPVASNTLTYSTIFYIIYMGGVNQIIPLQTHTNINCVRSVSSVLLNSMFGYGKEHRTSSRTYIYHSYFTL